jgi:hypothetical protein
MVNTSLSLHVILDYSNIDRGAVFVERNEDRVPVIGNLTLSWSQYERLGRPETIDIEISRVL